MSDDHTATLYDADTAEVIGEATPEQVAASEAAAATDGGAGMFLINGDGDPIADGSWGSDRHDVRRVYTI